MNGNYASEGLIRITYALRVKNHDKRFLTRGKSDMHHFIGSRLLGPACE